MEVELWVETGEKQWEQKVHSGCRYLKNPAFTKVPARLDYMHIVISANIVYHDGI